MLKTIVLIGMMGSGKTSVGKELAKKLNLSFIDIDHEIERKYDKTVFEIFKKKGEPFFRKIEENISCKLINGKPSVIALGGGAYLNKKIRKRIKLHGISIWVNASLENIYLRINNSKNKRPLLDYKNLKKTIKEIYDERKPIYKMADYMIKSNSNSKSETVNKIIKIL